MLAGFSIYHNFQIAAPREQVFDAVTQPHHLNNWWTQKCSGIPQQGQEYNLFFTPEYNWYGEVTSCVPSERFYIKMTSADDDWLPTSFGFDLEATSKGTLVRFSHKNWPECNDHFRKSSFCWAMLLSYLRDYVETGKVVPFEERE